MEKQLLFRDSYVNHLKTNINIDKYKESTFFYDTSKTLVIPNITKPSNLNEKLNYNDDYQTAISIYEAFKELEPIQASDSRFWTYLTHVDLFSYMKTRWNKFINFNEEHEAKDYILKYWFLKSTSQDELMRHPIAGLWWAVYLSVDEERINKYELTKILFRQLDFPTRTLGTYKLGRHKEAVIGILEFIQENESNFSSNFQNKTRFITKYLNSIGGVKPLAYFDRSFFKAELNKINKVSLLMEGLKSP